MNLSLISHQEFMLNFFIVVLHYHAFLFCYVIITYICWMLSNFFFMFQEYLCSWFFSHPWLMSDLFSRPRLSSATLLTRYAHEPPLTYARYCQTSFYDSLSSRVPMFVTFHHDSQRMSDLYSRTRHMSAAL